MIYIGIDPGAKGGYALVNAKNDAASAYPWNDVEFVNWLIGLKESGETIARACVEKVSSMPGQGVASTFKFGTGFGYIQGALTALKIPFQLVPPKNWKKEYSLDNDKQKSIDACQRLFPDVNLILPRCRKPNDGMAEALLIAEYAKRHF